MHVHMHLYYSPSESQTVPLDAQVDLPKQWVLKNIKKALSTQEAPPPHPHPLPPPLVPLPHPLGLRLCSVLAKNKCLQEEVTHSSYRSFTLQCEGVSGRFFPEAKIWKEDRKRMRLSDGGMGVDRWWVDEWQTRRWDRGTEDKLCLPVKTPGFGTMVLGQFWATCREPGFLYTPYHLELLLLFVTLDAYLWGG